MSNSVSVVKRESNFELLRIVLMLMIIGRHVIEQHGQPFLLSNNDEICKLFFQSFFCSAVNAFVLISGFFGIKFKIDRLFRLVIQTFFYSAFFLVFSVIVGWHTFSIRPDVFAFLPIFTKQYWFITCYVILYILAPWLNLWVGSLDKYMYKRFLVIGFCIVYVWPTISFLINAPQFIEDSGFGIVNFVYLYMLGRYFHFHHESKCPLRFYWGGVFPGVVIAFPVSIFYIMGHRI